LEQRSIRILVGRGRRPAPPEMATVPPRWARGDVSIESLARPVAVDHRITIQYYFRIADNLLRQADVYREEKNLLDLYIILLRYSR
jgi:STAM-binding protein